MPQTIVTPSIDPGGNAALANTNRTPPGWVRLTCSNPPLDTLALMGEGSPRYVGGFGGWDVTQRPRQVGMTTWAGSEPLSLELSLVFDGLRGERSQEPVLRKLYAVARGDDDSPPGILNVRGIALVADDWVIDTLDMGDALRRDYDHAIVRQQVTLTLREYVPPEYVQLRRARLERKTKTVTVKDGDTLASLARKHRCKWTDIRGLNITTAPPRQPWKANSTLLVGSQLRVPVQAAHKRRAKGSAKSLGSAVGRKGGPQ
jgi:hypothetical protein